MNSADAKIAILVEYQNTYSTRFSDVEETIKCCTRLADELRKAGSIQELTDTLVGSGMEDDKSTHRLAARIWKYRPFLVSNPHGLCWKDKWSAEAESLLALTKIDNPDLQARGQGEK